MEIASELIDAVSYTHLDVYKRQKQALTVFGTFAAVVFTALFTFPAYDIYFDDEKKKEYYSREEKHLKRGNGNWFVRNLIWLLPILIPILVEGISQLIVYVKG